MTAAGLDRPDEAAPVGTGEFARRMAELGPFEPEPAVAVGVSGGPDSLALCLLLNEWTAARGGTLLALTVDHGLRMEAAAEAALVGRVLADRGLRHETLVWSGPKPVRAVQAGARSARLELLTRRCRTAEILHLALAHHREDQAETVLLRLAKGSGVAGLAGMAAVTESADVRILRPLLALPKARLVATCRARGVAWIEDPSNPSPVFARGRLRAVTAALGAEGLTAASLAETALRAGRARAVLDTVVAEALARWVTVYPEGYAEVDPDLFAVGPRHLGSEEVGRLCLARIVQTVGGHPYPPRRERLDRLFDELRRGASRTLGGCRLLASRRAGGPLLIVREWAAATDRRELAADSNPVWWDRRFLVRLGGDAGLEPLAVARLGPGTPRELRERVVLPVPVLPGLPALWRGTELVAVPHLRHVSPEAPHVTVDFRPVAPLAGAPFAPAVVWTNDPIIYTLEAKTTR